MRALRFCSILGIAVAAGLLAWPPAGDARDTSVFTNNPYPCTIKSRAAEAPRQVADAAAPDGKATDRKDKDASDRRLKTIGDMFAALRGCWVPPVKDDSRAGTQLSVRLSFKRNGEPVGPPRVTYVSPGTPADVRKTYLDAVTAAFNRCTPLPFTRGLGGALAGRPIAIRFVDDRK